MLRLHKHGNWLLIEDAYFNVFHCVLYFRCLIHCYFLKKRTNGCCFRNMSWNSCYSNLYFCSFWMKNCCSWKVYSSVFLHSIFVAYCFHCCKFGSEFLHSAHLKNFPISNPGYYCMNGYCYLRDEYNCWSCYTRV